MPKLLNKDSTSTTTTTNARSKGGKTTCEIEGCGKTFSNATDCSRHKWSHLPRCLLPRCPFENCTFVYNGRNGALETHWKDHHSHLSAIGQPFPAIASRESLVPSKKPVKKTSTKLSWPSLDDVLAHYQVALGEHPVNPPTQHLPIPYPPHLIHTMRHVAIPDECDSYPTPQALSAPSPAFYPMEGGIINTPSIPYSQPMAGFAPDLQQFYADGLLPTFDQCLTALQPMAPLNHSSFGATPTMVSPSFTSSSFSTLDGPWDFPIANQQIQFDMVGNGFMDLSSAPFVPMPQSSIFESEGVWDQHSGPFLNGYI